MKKKLLLIATAILSGIMLTLSVKEGVIYLAGILMAVIVIISLRNLSPWMIRVTRWAKANPRKAQVLITVLQVVILSIGLIVGYDLKQLGYKLNDGAAIVFGLIMLAGFLSVPFFPKKNTIALPVIINRDRIAYTGIIIAAYAITVFTGNRVDDKYPNSILADVLKSIDEKIFLQYNTIDDEELSFIETGQHQVRNGAVAFAAFTSIEINENPSNEPSLSKKESKAKLKELKKSERLEKKQERMMKRVEKLRKLFAGGASGGSVFTIILLALVLCGGICLIVGGISGGSIGAVALGVVVSAASIYGIVKVSKKRRANRALKPEKESTP